MHDGEARHQTLDALNVVDMQANFFLESVELLIHFDFKIVSSSFNFSLQLNDLLFQRTSYLC